MTSRVCVLGSINMDVVVHVDKFPTTGETIVGLSCDLMPGGKGANQAVAIANMGVPVDLIGAVGADEFGKLLREYLAQSGLNIDAVVQIDAPSGTAIVTVNKEGHNQIVVVLGSNTMLPRDVIELYLERQKSVVQYLVSQFEIPLNHICYAFGKAKSWGATTVLNPSPIQSISQELIEQTDIFVLNELELVQVTGMTEINPLSNEIAKTAFEWARNIGDKIVVVTLGENGIIAVQDGEIIKQSVQKVACVVDTTGAGDCFCGSLVAFLHKGYSLYDSLSFAQKAAAYSVQKEGAGLSFPKLESLNLNKTKGETR